MDNSKLMPGPGPIIKEVTGMENGMWDTKDKELKKALKKFEEENRDYSVLEIIMTREIERALIAMKKHKFRTDKTKADFITGWLSGKLGLDK